MPPISDDTFTLTARWVFPVAGPPLEHGVVTISGGRIAAVEPPGARSADRDFGNAAIIPGLVNAHTHLDLSGLRGKVPPSPDFTGWLRGVIAHRRRQTPADVQADVRAGLAEALRYGTMLIGDIAAEGASWDALVEAPVWSVCFRELLGVPEDRAATTWEGWRWWREARPELTNCRPGISPHAPYSVRSSLFFAAATEAVPVMTHLAETIAEIELLTLRRGTFVAFLKELGVWCPDGLVDDPDDVLRLTSGLTSTVYAHCNYLRPDAPIPGNGTIVYCPRTHAAFGHPPHPFADFLARGVRVALGTDSLASNPDLSVLAEARFLRQRRPEVAGDIILRMATLAGAEALGFADTTGSLEPGKSADLVVVPLPNADAADPHELLLTPDDRLPTATLWRGRWRDAGWG